MAFLLVLIITPLLAQARLGSGIVDLGPADFDVFVNKHSKVMVDFVDGKGDGKEDQTSELKQALRMIRDYGSTVPVARVDASKYPEFAKKYFHNIGCDDETQECGDRFPQLLWFHHGIPTQYHRMLRKPQNIMSFVLALDRDPIDTINAEDAMDKWNQVILVRSKRSSPLYKTVEVVAQRHMDGAAFVHIECDTEQIQWAVNGTVDDTFKGDPTADSIDNWVRQKLTLSEDLPASKVDDGSVIVVGKTFEQLVLRKDADTMMIVYAPWCGFCRKVMPEWAKLAYVMRDSPGAPIVLKMDGTQNRSPLPDFHWNSFPTVVYLRKGERTPILYHDSERTMDTFLDFAKEHSTSPIEIASESFVMLQTGRLREL